ncbi:hypothetical protein P8A18_06255 [Streptomyces castrisilvae]|uniref:Uncharacterized protein n=1 Tax=Streptomyces castrisilvae TaxID=3033811 RepID=A0ABY9HFV6_9ACTN|nr:hypothetical protein [Streptomyces sp. Mut1]WLQ33074.1 hypothetical protein P8A18_06255 [Streptomyces sp. Mut1]
MKALLQEIDALSPGRTRVRLLLETGPPEESGPAPYDTAYLETFRRGRPWLTVLPTHPEVHAAGGALRVLDEVLRPLPGSAVPPHAFLALAPEAPAAGPAPALAAALAAAGVPAARVHQDASGIAEVAEGSARTTGTGCLSA